MSTPPFDLELLTLPAELPTDMRSIWSMAVMHAQDPIPKLPHHLRHWQRFMNRALAKQAAQRFQDAAQMADAIRRVQQRKPWSPALEALQQLRPSQRWAKPVWATLGVTAVTLVVLAFSLGRDDNATPPAATTPVAATPDATPAQTEGTSGSTGTQTGATPFGGGSSGGTTP